MTKEALKKIDEAIAQFDDTAMPYGSDEFCLGGLIDKKSYKTILATLTAAKEMIELENVDGLKPCPFCGGEAELFHTVDSSFMSCTTEYCGNDAFNTEDEAIAAWNTRKTPIETLIKALED